MALGLVHQYRHTYVKRKQLDKWMSTWGGIRTTWCGTSAEWMGSQTLAGRLRLSKLSSAKSRWVLASFVGRALKRFPIPINARMNSCWGERRGAPQVPGVVYIVSLFDVYIKTLHRTLNFVYLFERSANLAYKSLFESISIFKESNVNVTIFLNVDLQIQKRLILSSLRSGLPSLTNKFCKYFIVKMDFPNTMLAA